MKPICTNLGDFEALRKAGQLYVDKTAYFHRLITDPSRTYFFCARPRRFGKSLGVTTLKSIFLGHCEFFKDLAIAKTDYDWKPHAVIHFNWGCVDHGKQPSTNLGDAIDFFYAKDGVGAAILIDESAAAALAQIREKGYAKPYLADGLPIHCIGLNFDSKTRQLTDAEVETLTGNAAA